MPRGTAETTTSGARRTRSKKAAKRDDDVKLTGDRLVVHIPENGERRSAGG